MYQLEMHIIITEVLSIVTEMAVWQRLCPRNQNTFRSKDKVRKIYALNKLREGYWITISNKLKPKPYLILDQFVKDQYVLFTTMNMNIL